VRRVALVAVMAMLVAAGGRAAGRSMPDGAASNPGRPLWRLDLRPLGYPPQEGSGTTAPFERDKIAFGGNDEVVILGDTNAFPKPSRVEAFAIATATGKVTSRATWTVALRPRLFATAAGRYAALTIDGTVLHAAGLDSEVARSTMTVVMASPDGRALLAEPSGAPPGRAVMKLIEADTLRPIGVDFQGRDIESAFHGGVARVTRSKGAGAATVSVDDATRSVPVRETGCGEAHPSFLTGEVLAILGCGRMEVVGRDGRLLFETTIGPNTSLAAVARDGSRFAIIEADWVWRKVPRLRGERLRIFDLAAGGELSVLELSELRGSDFPASSGAALSPDGSRLAVNARGRMSLYRLARR